MAKEEVSYAFVIEATSPAPLSSATIEKVKREMERRLYDMSAGEGVLLDVSPAKAYRDLSMLHLKVQGEVNAAR